MQTERIHRSGIYDWLIVDVLTHVDTDRRLFELLVGFLLTLVEFCSIWWNVILNHTIILHIAWKFLNCKWFWLMVDEQTLIPQ